MALAERIEPVVPASMRVRVDGEGISIFIGNEMIGGSDATLLLRDEHGGSTAERANTAILAALSEVQDCISEQLTEPWPQMPDGGMALPSTRVDAVRVYLWYGNDERMPTLGFPPIDLASLSDTT